MNINRLLKAIDADVVAGVEQLRGRGVMPTLGVLVTEHSKAHLDSFQSALNQRAGAVGLDLRVLDLTREVVEEDQFPPHIRSQLDDLPASWQWAPPAGSRNKAAVSMQLGNLIDELHAMQDFEILGQFAGLPRADTSQDDFLILRWLAGQRIAYLAAPLKRLAGDRNVHGIICPPPLPKGVHHRSDLAALVPLVKDVDGIHPGSLATLLPYPGIARPDIMLTGAATSAVAPDAVRVLAVALLLLATVNAAARQCPVALSTSG